MLDNVGQPLVATVAGIVQPDGRTAINWATVPTIVERELEVEEGNIKAYGISMHPLQGLFTAEAVERIRSGVTAPISVPYFKSLIRTS